MRGKKKKRVLVMGGDKRELYLLRELANSEYKVSAFAIPKGMLPKGILYCGELTEEFALADIIILPMPGISNEGKLYAPMIADPIYIQEEQWQQIRKHTIVLVGVASMKLKELADDLQWALIETAELDEIAIPNSIPTAEGAIQIAVKETDFTLDGAMVVVLGYGRVGEVLSKKLRALNSNVQVVNRGSNRKNLAETDGFVTANWENLASVLRDGDIIYNTVPSLVITEEILAQMKKEAIIVDLASRPGGTDFTAAEKYGIKAILASGLPGKVAPKFAGELLAKVYPELMAQALKEQEQLQKEEKANREKAESEKTKTEKAAKQTTMEQHKVKIRKKSVAAATMKVNGKVKKAQKTVHLFESTGEEMKKTASKAKKQKKEKLHD